MALAMAISQNRQAFEERVSLPARLIRRAKEAHSARVLSG
jgi:hypothetical protein